MERRLNPAWYRATASVPAVAEQRIVRSNGKSDEYAHVRVWVQPAPRGSGNIVSWHAGSNIPDRYVESVVDGVMNGLRTGVLGDIEFVDVIVTIETGSYHESDSNESVFSEAAESALTQALRRAHPVLLEAILAITAVVPEEFTGAVQNQLAPIEGMVVGEKQVSITGKVRASEAANFMKEALRNTQGVARFSFHAVDFVEGAEGWTGPDTWAVLT